MRTLMYHAFISYSHRADAKLAPVLQRALERLGTPWWKRAPVRVFRDDSSLPASAALWPAIETGLRLSEYLVLLASPASAASTWVDKELQWWLANRPRDRLLIVVTAGRIAYDAHVHDFDWEQTDCLPPSLRSDFDSEPLWTDLRFATRPEHRSLRHSGFRSAALGMAAAIRGVAKDDLERIDIRQHRRAMVIALGALGVIAALGLAAAGALLFAQSGSRTANVNHLQAESRRLAAEALTQLDGGHGIETATLKAALAWRLSPTDDARRALRRIDEATPDVARVLARHTSQLRALAFSRDGQRLATLGDEGVVLQWSLADGRQVGTPLASERQWMQQLRYSRDGSHLLVSGTRSDDSRVPTLAVFRLADGARLPTGEAWRGALGGGQPLTDEACTAISPSGAQAAVEHGSGIVVIDTARGSHKLFTVPQKLRVAALGFVDETRLSFIAITFSGYPGRSRAGRIDLALGTVTLGQPQPQDGYPCGFSNFSDDGQRVVFPAALGQQLLLWRVDEQLALRALPMPEPRPSLGELTGHHAPEFDATGRRIAWGLDGKASIWEPDARRLLKTLPRMNDGHGRPLALSADGRFVAALDGSTPIVWALDGDEATRRIEGSRCGSGWLEDACIQRLCERLTRDLDPKRANELLGEGYDGLLAALQGTRCEATGAAPTFLPR